MAEGRDYPVMDAKLRNTRISFLKRSMVGWTFKDFQLTMAKIKKEQNGQGRDGDVEHSRRTTDNMLRWQAIRELLEEKLKCTSK